MENCQQTSHFNPHVHPHHFSSDYYCVEKTCTTANQNICWQVLSVLSSAPQKQKSSRLLQNTSVCPHCYQWLQPDNHRMRLRPKQRPSARVQSILRRKARGKRLSFVQKNLLRRFQKSCSVLVQNTIMNCTALQHTVFAGKHKGHMWCGVVVFLAWL